MTYLYIYLGMVTGALCTLVAMTAMRRGEKHNVGKFGWLVLTLLSPPLGLLLFLIFGGRKVSAEHDERETIQFPEMSVAEADVESSLAKIGVERGLPPLSEHNRLRFLDSPETIDEALFDLIDAAQQRLFVHTFILADDDIGDRIIDRLCERARSGVEVRLMVDGFGSFELSDDPLERVRDAGGKAARFKPMTKLSRFAYLNFRNHRKLIVADGDHALIGGANLVDTEITPLPDDETWIDYSLRIDGIFARQAEAVFLSDWNFVTEEGLEGSDTPHWQPTGAPSDNSDDPSHDDAATLQIVPVGPDGPTEILGDLWLTGINRAHHRVWIVTPYFVPPPMAMRSLAMAARRGVEVRIIVPHSSDMAPADYARLDYLHDLAKLDVEVLRHPSRMVHAKMLLLDDAVAYCGSANFDMRSFFLNYELVVGIFNEAKVREVADWFESLAEQCSTGPMDDTWTRRALGVLARMAAEEL